MSLDPKARALLDALPPIGDLVQADLPAMRAQSAQWALPVAVATLPRVENLSAAGPSGTIPLRLYATSTDRALPVLIFFHGGGWVFGDLNGHDVYLSRLASCVGDCAIVSVDYRLAPEHPFPAAIEDCYAAKEWVAANAARLGLDASRLAVGGDSAGANLAAAVAIATRERGGSPLIQQTLIYPVLDANLDTPSYRDNASGYLLTRDMMRFFWDSYVPKVKDRSNPLAAPLRSESLAGLPPTLILTAGFDPLRDEGMAYADRLRAAAVAVELVNYETMFHGFTIMLGLLDQADRALHLVAHRLSQAFRKSPRF